MKNCTESFINTYSDIPCFSGYRRAPRDEKDRERAGGRQQQAQDQCHDFRMRTNVK